MKRILITTGLVLGIALLAVLMIIKHDTSNSNSQERISSDIEAAEEVPFYLAPYQSKQMDVADEELVSKINFLSKNRRITAVDLGLPSGTKWADRNVGAASPYDYGNLYRYGNPHTQLDGSNNKYAEEDNIIGTKKDVAKSVLGGKWVTPSSNQIEELLKCCKSHLLTIKGKKIVAVIGPNEKFILFPLVGCMFNFGRSQSDLWGLYEAGNLVRGKAIQLVVNDEGKADMMDSQSPGYYGCAIRAVEK